MDPLVVIGFAPIITWAVAAIAITLYRCTPPEKP